MTNLPSPSDHGSLVPAEPEPWDLAAQREHGLRDYAAIALLGVVGLVVALAPSARLVVLTGLRLAIAAGLLAVSALVTGWTAQVLLFAAHGFLVLALFSLAAHIEAATLGPLVDRIVGRTPG